MRRITRTQQQWRSVAEQLHDEVLAVRIRKALEKAGPGPFDDIVDESDVPLTIAFDHDEVRRLEQHGIATE
jgi:hypothetical protein